MDAECVNLTSKRVVFLFEWFYRKSTHRTKYELNLDLGHYASITYSFLERLDKHYTLPAVGSNTLIQYFVYQFQYWHEKTTKRPVTLGWILGPKAFARWLAKPDYHFLFSRDGIVAEWNLNVRQLYLELERKSDHRNPLTIPFSELLEKQRFFNTIRGFAHCLEFTTLYVQSRPCNVCTHARDCKIALEANYPELYRARFPAHTDLSVFRPL